MSALSISREGHVALLVFDRPPNNHVSVDLLRDLADAIDALDADASCRAIVLASAGKNFCAGADFSTRSAAQGDSTQALYEQAARLFAARKPIVAAVQGAAIGAGLGLALVADHRIADRTSRFSANFTALGFHPGFALTATLPRLVGMAAASRMFLTARRLKAEEALAIGLADEIAPEGEARAHALALAREIAANAPLAVQATRATLRAGLALAARTQMAAELREQTWLRATADFAEGVRAVAERRAGNFTGT